MASEELMEILSGDLDVLLPGADRRRALPAFYQLSYTTEIK